MSYKLLMGNALLAARFTRIQRREPFFSVIFLTNKVTNKRVYKRHQQQYRTCSCCSAAK